MIAALIAAAALGQATPAPVAKEPDKVIVAKNQHETFDGSDIDGRPDKGVGTYTVGLNHAKFKVMVPLRANFNDKLQTSTDNL